MEKSQRVRSTGPSEKGTEYLIEVPTWVQGSCAFSHQLLSPTETKGKFTPSDPRLSCAPAGCFSTLHLPSIEKDPRAGGGLSHTRGFWLERNKPAHFKNTSEVLRAVNPAPQALAERDGNLSVQSRCGRQKWPTQQGVALCHQLHVLGGGAWVLDETPWLQPRETPSRGPTHAVPKLLPPRNCGITNGNGFQPLSLCSSVIRRQKWRQPPHRNVTGPSKLKTRPELPLKLNTYYPVIPQFQEIWVWPLEARDKDGDAAHPSEWLVLKR